MDIKDIDVELEALLNENNGSGEVETPVASDKNINNDKPASESVITPIEKEESSRANERIQQLLKEKKDLEDRLNSQSNSDLDKFVDSIQDEPSRNLLKQYGKLMTETFRKEVSPVMDEYNTAKFDREFSKFEGITDLAAHKEELRKTFLRNPSQSLKALVGEILVDNQSSKIVPIERSSSQVNRSAPNIADASKDDLYALLESMPLR